MSLIDADKLIKELNNDIYPAEFAALFHGIIATIKNQPSPWINVKNELPGMNGPYMAIGVDGKTKGPYVGMLFYQDGKFYSIIYGMPEEAENVVYWMKIPKFPEDMTHEFPEIKF